MNCKMFLWRGEGELQNVFSRGELVNFFFFFLQNTLISAVLVAGS